MNGVDGARRMQTGVKGLDEITGGGFLFPSTVTVSGGPGTGKTILASEFLYRGAIDHGDPGVYVSLGESKREFFQHTASFGWDFSILEKQGTFLFLDFTFENLVNVIYDKHDMDDEVDGTPEKNGAYWDIVSNFFNVLIENVRAIGARRVVIDPLNVLKLVFPNPFIARREIMRLFSILSDISCTTLVVSELEQKAGFSVEEFSSSGIIRLSFETSQHLMQRTLIIYKLRGISFNEKVFSIKIGRDGLEIIGEMVMFQG